MIERRDRPGRHRKVALPLDLIGRQHLYFDIEARHLAARAHLAGQMFGRGEAPREDGDARRGDRVEVTRVGWRPAGLADCWRLQRARYRSKPGDDNRGSHAQTVHPFTAPAVRPRTNWR